MNNHVNHQNHSMLDLNESSVSNMTGGEILSKSQVDQKLLISQLYQSQKNNDVKHYYSYQKGQFPHQYEVRK